MIRMVQGSTRVGLNLHSASTGAFSADQATEDRLVSLGVAVRVEATDHAETSPRADSAVVANAEAPGGASTPAGAEIAAEGDGEATGGHLDPEQLLTMSNAELKKLAEDMGLDASKCRTKAAYIALIVAADVEIEPEDGEAPPDLSAEAPVG